MTLDRHIRPLLIGGVIYSQDADGAPFAFPEIDELQSLWQKVGDRLTAECIESGPGERPWAWWQWSRPAELPPPLFTWPLMDAGRIGGVSRRNRVAPADQDQRRVP